ncbi:MAG: Uma2 family endonuclease [Planctomycetes bacterium]|nr:Uma2 family endonuclease [Planctomycetota bacterium]
MSTASVLEPVESPLRDSESLFEIVDGLRVEKPPMSLFACLLANYLAHQLDLHARQFNLGRAVVEILFHLPLPVDRNRRPDLAFVSYDRWPKDRAVDPNVNAWDVVPNIAVESISPNDLIDELTEKIDEYFRAGVQQVWVIHPKQKRIDVYESPTAINVLTEKGILDGGKVLPQFRLPLKELFGD